MQQSVTALSAGHPSTAWNHYLQSPLHSQRAGLCTQTALEQLALENVGLSIRACQALAELLTHPQTLHVLHFRNNMTDDAGATALAQVRSGAGGLSMAVPLSKPTNARQSCRQADACNLLHMGDRERAWWQPVWFSLQIVRQATGLRALRLASSRIGPQGGVEIIGALSAGGYICWCKLLTAAIKSASDIARYSSPPGLTHNPLAMTCLACSGHCRQVIAGGTVAPATAAPCTDTCHQARVQLQAAVWRAWS